MLNKQEIITIIDTYKNAVLDMCEAAENEDEAKLLKVAKREQLVKARESLSEIRF